MGLIDALGIDIKILIAQLVNFAIIYFVLKKFAWNKIMAFLEKRQQEIEQGLNNAKEAEKTLESSNAIKEEMVIEARRQAAQIVGDAQAQANQIGDEIINKAQEKASQIMQNGEAEIAKQKSQMLREVKDELADLVVLGVQNVVATGIDKNQVQEKYLNESLTA